jgi:uncharacterized Zn-binding protein involved in type VI secretion
MPAPILHTGAEVRCAHGGQATPTVASKRVTVSGAPIVTVAATYIVAGCEYVPPIGNGPCVTGNWVTGAARVTSEGQPVAVLSSVGVCAPTGTPLLGVTAQMRAVAS